MAMQWIKGLVAPAAEFAGQQLPQPGAQQQQPGGPPVGGAAPPMGGSPYGVQPQGAAPPGAAPQGQGFDPSAMQWSTGTKTQGSAGGISKSSFASTMPQTPNALAAAGPQTSQSPQTPQSPHAPQSLEARCAQLQHDLESLALFARTLLTMLEESKVVTREQFEATKHRLDMLDGKLDDR